MQTDLLQIQLSQLKFGHESGYRLTAGSLNADILSMLRYNADIISATLKL